MAGEMLFKYINWEWFDEKVTNVGLILGRYALSSHRTIMGRVSSETRGGFCQFMFTHGYDRWQIYTPAVPPTPLWSPGNDPKLWPWELQTLGHVTTLSAAHECRTVAYSTCNYCKSFITFAMVRRLLEQRPTALHPGLRSVVVRG
jgi:hypothetical protein